MGIDPGLLREQCARTLDRTDFPALGERFEGKVRDSYIAKRRRTIIVSDRVSCFDRVVGTLPFKGQVLNEVAAFWFERTRDIARNHLIAVPDPVVSVVEDVTPLPVEFVMRGHLTGSTSTSIWTAYARGERSYCGHRLRDGMRKHEPLPEPLLTPTTKATHGGHDEPASREQLVAAGAIDAATFDRAAAMAHALFREGTRFAATRGLILVDTKYEIGVDASGELLVIDEIHTPDSSRYWIRERFDRAMRDGTDPEALDKEYLRRWLGEQGYRGEGPVPEIPLDVRCEAARRYIEAFEQVTGEAFEPNVEEPLGRIRRNLGIA